MVNELIKVGASRIKNVADRPLNEARLLLAYTLNCNLSDTIINNNIQISETLAEKYFKYIEKRKNNMPIAYITGKQEFYGLEFEVNESVLIPRADTETIVEFILSQDINSMLDICSGSGCICIASAVYNKKMKCTAVEISQKAINISQLNAKKHGARIEFIQADIFEKFKLNNKFDMIVSNPPYIKTEDLKGLMPDVRNFEPHLALDGGISGLIFYKRICEIATKYLNPKGILAFEIGIGQETEVSEIMSDNFKNISTICDISGIKRVIHGEFKKSIDSD